MSKGNRRQTPQILLSETACGSRELTEGSRHLFVLLYINKRYIRVKITHHGFHLAAF